MELPGQTPPPPVVALRPGNAKWYPGAWGVGQPLRPGFDQYFQGTWWSGDGQSLGADLQSATDQNPPAAVK